MTYEEYLKLMDGLDTSKTTAPEWLLLLNKAEEIGYDAVLLWRSAYQATLGERIRHEKEHDV